jgi:hypothetical protein
VAEDEAAFASPTERSWSFPTSSYRQYEVSSRGTETVAEGLLPGLAIALLMPGILGDEGHWGGGPHQSPQKRGLSVVAALRSHLLPQVATWECPTEETFRDDFDGSGPVG